MLNVIKKVAMAGVIAGVAIGGFAPAASARNYVGRDVNRIVNRDANRIVNRDVARLLDRTADGVADTAQDTARALRQILNPR